jgi:hypothetical protein
MERRLGELYLLLYHESDWLLLRVSKVKMK